jgi:broad specificity polyphosphatase/5'/3'-nucleotidase SurE
VPNELVEVYNVNSEMYISGTVSGGMESAFSQAATLQVTGYCQAVGAASLQKKATEG